MCLQYLMCSKIAKVNLFFCKGRSPYDITIDYCQCSYSFVLMRLVVFACRTQVWTCRFVQHMNKYDVQTMGNFRKRGKMGPRFGSFQKITPASTPNGTNSSLHHVRRFLGFCLWETRWETRPNPCRDKISQSTRRQSGRQSGRQGGRQDGIDVVTRCHRALGDRVGDKVEDKMGHKVGDKAKSMS